MKISQSLASIYQTRLPAQKRSNDPPGGTPHQTNQNLKQERVVAGEVLRDQPVPTNEIDNKSRVFQQTLFQASPGGSERQGIASYEGLANIRKEGKTGEFIDLFA